MLFFRNSGLLYLVINIFSRKCFLQFFLFVIICVLFLLDGCGPKLESIRPPVEDVEIVPQETPKKYSVLDLWYQLLEEKMNVPPDEQLDAVNRFFNQLDFVDDMSLWGKHDYWATPLEMLVIKAGDCEDFAIAKYFTLRYLKVPDSRLRLTYVKSLKMKKPHMVLNYYPDSFNDDSLVLDSLVGYISQASERIDLIPVYSFNSKGYWVPENRRMRRVGDARKLKLWCDVMDRQRGYLTSVIPMD